MSVVKNKKLIVIIIAALVAASVAFFAVNTYINRPQDLGTELEFIGKRRTGCPIPLPFGYLMLCSADLGERYYFGTDLPQGDLIKHFKKAEYISGDEPIRSFGAGYNFDALSFTTPNSGFTFYFYDNKEGILNDFDLGHTTKKHIISIDSEDYKEAKNAL